ncbi:hypothetical protein BKA64DRAFT_180787 [Cadophora sp. MPI-SDFR-AT-0126]|nr:hypothetical protein BKA64DRAFT_180787 [Leotiomycetes sp. MPI-SDFR-AT-0126]
MANNNRAETSTISLETLPLIALHRISRELANSDCQRSSLHAYSLTSRRCCASADVQRFERIHLRFSNQEQFLREVQECKEVLLQDERFRLVRRLKVSPKVYRSGHGSDGLEKFEMDDFCRPPKRGVYYGTHWANAEESGKGWEALTSFVAELPCLRDYIHAHSYYVPSTLLTAIEDVGCSLHIHNFMLRSLLQPKGHPHDVHPDDLALITSPSLHSIAVPYAKYDSDGRVNYNREAALAMVQGMTPNLRHVCLRSVPVGATPMLDRAFLTPRPLWQGFDPKQKAERANDSGRPQVISLVLDGYMQPEDFRALTCCLDTCSLHAVTVRLPAGPRRIQIIQAIFKILVEGKFMAVQTLVISPVPLESIAAELAMLESSSNSQYLVDAVDNEIRLKKRAISRLSMAA